VRYQGTRLGRQELNAELLEDNSGALFHLENIEANRVTKVPELSRVVVAIDPATTSGEDSDETGIVVCGMSSGTPPEFLCHRRSFLKSYAGCNGRVGR